MAAGRADLALSYEPEVLIARDQGLPVTAVAAIVPSPLTSLIWLQGSGIRDVKDLKGKTIATAGIPYQSAYLDTILKKAGVNPDSVKEVNVGFKLTQAMISKKVDATIGAFWNVEGIQLEQAGRKPHIIRMEQVGARPGDGVDLRLEVAEVGAQQGGRDPDHGCDCRVADP